MTSTSKRYIAQLWKRLKVGFLKHIVATSTLIFLLIWVVSCMILEFVLSLAVSVVVAFVITLVIALILTELSIRIDIGTGDDPS